MLFGCIFEYCGCHCISRYMCTAAAKSLQSCPTLCDPIDGSPPGSPVPGILQAGTLEWVAISFSNAWKWKVKVKSLSHVRLLATPWTAANQAPPPMGFSRQEYWSGVPLPSPICVLVDLKRKEDIHLSGLIFFFSIHPVILKTNFWKTYLLPASWRKFWNYYTEDWCSHWRKTRRGWIHNRLAEGCWAQRSHHKFHVFR